MEETKIEIGSIDGEIITYKYLFNELLKIEFYHFFYKKASCSYIYYKSIEDTITLDQFINSNKGTGHGRQLFCFTLNWLKQKLSKIEFVNLSAYPLKISQEKISQEKLNLYYTNLGFEEIYKNEFKQNIDILIEKCKSDHIGCGTQKTRRKTRRKTIKTRRKKIYKLKKSIY